MRVKLRLVVASTLLSLLSVITTAAPTSPSRHDDPIPISAEALRDSIGRSVGQTGFDAAADLNSDGVVNALDVTLFRLAEREGRPATQTVAPAPIVGATERIVVQPTITTALPGHTVSIFLLLRDNTTALTSYSIDVSILGYPGSVGEVTANIGLTNFFDQKNLITACPLAACPTAPTRDSFFSVITQNGNGGVSLTTSTSDFSTVLATNDVNDVLAEVFFDVPPDALGTFTILLGSTSGLADANGASVPFGFTSGIIRVLDPRVVPTVSQWGMIVMGASLVAAGCVIFAKRSRTIAMEHMMSGTNDLPDSGAKT